MKNGGMPIVQIAVKILYCRINAFHMSRCTFELLWSSFFLMGLCSRARTKKRHRRRSIKSPFVSAVTPVQTTSFIPRLEDRHFNWVLLLWRCRSAKWETDWHGPGQEDFGLCGKKRLWMTSPAASPLLTLSCIFTTLRWRLVLSLTWSRSRSNVYISTVRDLCADVLM